MDSTDDLDLTLPPEGQAPRLDLDAIRRGSQVGRYTVVERIGAGGMGVVFSAWDPKLDRRVALKLVGGRGTGEATAAAHAQLQDEAKALAKLSHPNVVTVYDVGTVSGAVFIAMEYLQGQTLSAWRKAEGRDAPWAIVVQHYLDAGMGLAAAHAKGLVHRDFKPNNVMLTEGGVKVLDFGLARPSAAVEGDQPAGTPKYMAPEQHLSLGVDARSDQFSFCVALYEALYEQHPYAADTMMELLVKVQEGTITPPPRSSVPPRVRAAILRGLSTVPNERFASMDDLLGELDPRRVAAVRRRIAFGLAALATVGGAVAISTSGPTPCRDLDAPVRAVWNADRQQAVRDVLEGVEPALRARAEATFDAFADAWAVQRTDACVAARIDGSQTEAALELRYHCLDRRLDTAASIITPLADGVPEAKTKLGKALEDVPDLDRCADLDALRAEYPPPDADVRDEVRAILAERDRLHHTMQSGDVGEVQAGLEALLERADAVGYPPARARIRRTLGSIVAFRGDRPAGIAMLEEGAAIAIAAGSRTDAASNLLEIARLRSSLLGDTETALLLTRLAEATLEPLKLERHVERSLYRSRTAIYRTADRLPEAEENARARVASFEAAGELNTPSGIEARAELGQVLSALEKWDQAEAVLSAAIDEQTDGIRYAALGRALTFRARMRSTRGDLEGAVADFEDAYDVFVQRYGPNHSNALGRLGDVGIILAGAGQHARARDKFAESIAGYEGFAPAGSGNLALATMHENHAWMDLQLGAIEGVETSLDRAVNWRRGLTGERGRESTWSLSYRGRLAFAKGELEQARAHYTVAAGRTPEGRYTLAARVGLGEVELAEGKHARAREVFAALLDHPKSDSATKARANLGLARLELLRDQPDTARLRLSNARELLEKVPVELIARRAADALERDLDGT
ncbi:MAG: protein kinase [Myxococcota bacterium]